MVGAGLVLVLGGVMLIALAERSARNRLTRNRWAGVRTRTTLRTDAAWFAAQAAAAPWTRAAGFASMLAGLAAAVTGDRCVLLAGALLAGLVVSAGGVFGERAARIALDPTPNH